MKTVNIQYFALPEEVIVFLHNIKERYLVKLYVLFEKNNMVEAKGVDFINLDELKKGNYTFVLSPIEIKLRAMRIGQFEEFNSNALYINIGLFTLEELKESWMYSLKIASNESINNKWFEVGKELKKLTKTGGYSVFEPTGQRNKTKKIRYTDGALNTYLKGTRLVPSIGKNIRFELE